MATPSLETPRHATKREPTTASAEAILAAVDRLPGVHKSKLCTLAGIGWGNLTHHLHRLERSGLVRQVNILGRTRVCTLEFFLKVNKRRILVDPDARTILKKAEADGLVRPRQLQASLGIDERRLRKLLRMLVQDGILVRAGGYHPVYLCGDSSAQSTPKRQPVTASRA